MGTVERSLTLEVPVERLGEVGKCHKIELLVSSRFQGAPDFRLPETPGDIHQTIWWVALTDNSFSDAIEMDCP